MEHSRKKNARDTTNVTVEYNRKLRMREIRNNPSQAKTYNLRDIDVKIHHMRKLGVRKVLAL